MDSLKKLASFLASAKFNTALVAIVALVLPQLSDSLPGAAAEVIAAVAMGYNVVSNAISHVKADVKAPAAAPKAE